jgi:ectoine hydroxylase-related dioxygenase (phytanoyl-CoA dioxygenase family)
MYIHADGDEGDIHFIDKDPKVVGEMPPVPKLHDSVRIHPITGDLLLFPSACMHMVSPNLTKKERYSISFNFNIRSMNYKLGKNEDDMSRNDIKNLDNIWHIDDSGDFIY